MWTPHGLLEQFDRKIVRKSLKPFNESQRSASICILLSVSMKLFHNEIFIVLYRYNGSVTLLVCLIREEFIHFSCYSRDSESESRMPRISSLESRWWLGLTKLVIVSMPTLTLVVFLFGELNQSDCLLRSFASNFLPVVLLNWRMIYHKFDSTSSWLKQPWKKFWTGIFRTSSSL